MTITLGERVVGAAIVIGWLVSALLAGAWIAWQFPTNPPPLELNRINCISVVDQCREAMKSELQQTKKENGI